jgi:DNA-binding NtrC family response regulator
MAANGLLVDDSRPQLLACGRVLNSWGIDADLATTVHEAEANADVRSYDFALLDYAMPDSPGGPRDLIQKLRVKSPACKIFVVTAYRSEAFEKMADLDVPFLEKPLNWGELRDALEAPNEFCAL